MNINLSNDGRGVGFLGLLQVAFIILKLCKVINWSWVWVLAPLWGSVSLVVILVLVVVVYRKIKRF